VNKAIAIAKNDTVFLSWVYDDKIADCLGFAVYRTDSVGQSTPLPAWVGFKGGSNPDRRETTALVGGADFGVIDLNEHAMARLRGPKSLQIIPHASHLFPEPGALEAVIDHAAKWFRQYLAPVHSHQGTSE